MHKELYDIEPREFYVLNREEMDNDYLYVLEPVVHQQTCRFCNSSNIIGHGNAPRDIRDTSVHGHRVGLHILAKRYYCKDCKASFNDSFKSVDDDAKITRRLRNKICEESLTKPFLNIADEYGISDTTVRNIFKDYVSDFDKKRVYKTPRVLGIDENHLMRKYRAVFVDIEQRTILEMLPDRNLERIENFIKSLPDYQKIKCVTCDMYRGYINTAYDVIPGVTVIIDKFHVIKEVNNALESIRKRLRNSLSKADNDILRNSRFLLLSNSEDLSFEQAVKLKRLFEKYSVFEKPHQLKEEFRSIYLATSRRQAEMMYSKWCEKVNYAGYSEFIKVKKTVDRHYREIFNYFDYPYTNAVTESLNKLINDIAKAGRGYSFDILRLKCLYGTKATKSEKYDFKKYSVRNESYDRPGNMGYSMYFQMPYKKEYGVIEKKELVSGFGVDINELHNIVLNNEL